MAGDPSRVIVNQVPGTFMPQVQTNHKDFPEIRGEGGSAKESARLLVNHLCQALDTALTDWRRSSIEGAIEDAKAFVEQN
jgi:hypothetical protein